MRLHSDTPSFCLMRIGGALFLAVGALFAILGFLAGGAAAVCAGDVLFLLGFGLHLAFAGVTALAAPAEVDAVLQDLLKVVCHRNSQFSVLNSQFINGGTGGRR